MFKASNILAVAVTLFLGTATAIKEINAAACASDVIVTGKYLKFYGEGNSIRCFADKGQMLDVEIKAYGGVAAGNNEGRFEYYLDGDDEKKLATFKKEDIDSGDFGIVTDLEIY